LVALALPAAAQKHGPDDPVPPGAKAKVLPLSGKVTEIKGLASGVSGKVEALTAALKDLGAKVTEQEIRIELQADVLFDFDKADLKPEAVPSLQKVSTVVNGHPGVPVRIEGHTDSKGDDAYNMKLSERRAASVKGWLVQNGGVDAGRITTEGLGETRPVAPNTKPNGADDPDGRQKNRRVEITLKKG
jgi:photosystem I P700 chlorophyll a apoprotein A2